MAMIPPVAANDNEPLLPRPISFGWWGFFVPASRASLPSQRGHAAPVPRSGTPSGRIAPVLAKPAPRQLTPAKLSN
jgi:hypothetical protein